MHHKNDLVICRVSINTSSVTVLSKGVVNTIRVSAELPKGVVNTIRVSAELPGVHKTSSFYSSVRQHRSMAN